MNPARIEAALQEHPGVTAAAVAGVADPVTGEAAAALVVAAPGCAPGCDELRSFCAERLPHYMVPRFVRFVEDLPRNPAGKLLRDRVAQMLRREPSTV